MLTRIGDRAAPEFRSGFETLCRRYWRPVYYAIRYGWGKSNEDAKDLTQAFFLWLLEGPSLEKYEHDRGSFRRYLKVLLGGFVGHHEEAKAALKRGGRAHMLDLDGQVVPFHEVLEDPRESDPGRILDRAWVAQVIESAVAKTRAHLAEIGRELHFRVYERYEMVAPDQRPTYAALASDLGLKETDVANYLFAVREMIRAEVRQELADTLQSADEIEDEWNALFGS